ncbi:hypothetical protein [Succinatimonas hippei]|uniref:hypothetical protein n=1 Tax=Succinatimonas hippei TaxID=626938 RepID=UPI00255C5E0F|nr:hypothetical protein [Succinatimonas hippei]
MLEDLLLRRNLIDAGCDNQQIDKFLKLNASGKVPAQLNLLKEQRRHLLECLHFRQMQIDCLDFLIGNLQKSN